MSRYLCETMNIMTKLKYILLLPVVCLSISAIAQDQTTERRRRERADSISLVERRSDNLSDLKSDRDKTKARADEAQRVEKNANSAAKESRLAYRAEQKAQKLRIKADKQARKAAKARAKSGN